MEMGTEDVLPLPSLLFRRESKRERPSLSHKCSTPNNSSICWPFLLYSTFLITILLENVYRRISLNWCDCSIAIRNGFMDKPCM